MPRFKPQRILSQASAPFQSFTSTSPRTTRDSQRNRGCPPLPRFLPLQRLPVTKSHISPTAPTPPVTLRPQGFAPSRRLAPLATSRAYSIPVPLLGFNPPRPSSSPGTVRPLGRRAPQGFSSTTVVRRGRPSRDTHTGQSLTTGLGFSQVAAPNASMGFPAPRFDARHSEGRSRDPASPHALLSARPHADQTVRTPGYSLLRTQSVSLEIDQPPCSSSPRCSSRLLGDLAGLGYGLPSEADPRRHGSRPHLHPAVKSPA
jgi:hypothetical protein